LPINPISSASDIIGTAGAPGIATSVVNTAIFLGAGVLQPLVGWAVDRGRAAGDVDAGWQAGIAILAGAAAVGALASLAVREKAPR